MKLRRIHARQRQRRNGADVVLGAHDLAAVGGQRVEMIRERHQPLTTGNGRGQHHECVQAVDAAAQFEARRSLGRVGRGVELRHVAGLGAHRLPALGAERQVAAEDDREGPWLVPIGARFRCRRVGACRRQPVALEKILRRGREAHAGGKAGQRPLTVAPQFAQFRFSDYIHRN